MKSPIALIALAALVLPGLAQAADSGTFVRYIACPIYRDTQAGRKSGCWLADYAASGTRYDVTLSPYKPDWNREVLVEGWVSDNGNTDACGAQVLDPVRTSILPGRCPRHMLPAEGYKGRPYSLPPRNIAPLSIARPVPPGPYGPRTFPIFFEFDRDFLVYQYDDYLIDKAVTWIRAAKPKKLVVTGYAATEPEIVSGREIAERPEMAQRRADAVALTLSRLLPGMRIETRARLASTPLDTPDADNIPGQSQRRAEIEAIF